MKQNVKNIKQQRIYKRRRTALAVILILLLALMIAIYASTTTTNNVADNSSLIKTNSGNIDISSIISNEPNAPAVGAGMIPIKWNGEKWEITSKDNSSWYNYSEGKWATVMLSDGFYKSEVEIGINENKQLAEKNIGKTIEDNELGTIFIWVPRLCYNDTQIEFLKGLSVVDFKWTTESCFNLEKFGPNAIDLAYEGIWVGQNEFASVTEVENKNSEMNTEYNKQGLIANERVATLTASDKKAVQKLYEKSKNEIYTPEEIENIQNRQTIKIVNANKRLPIMGTHIISGNNIVVSAKYSENSIKYCLDKNGNILVGNMSSIDAEEIHYTFYLVDSQGNIRRYTMNYGSGKPYLKGFNKNNTFYVVYDDEGNETSEIPIGEEEPANWYSYENQKWANIVVRDNGNEIYYTWIPRYMYKLDSENETVDAKFVDLDNVYVDENGKEIKLSNSEYKLPEAFTWEDPDNANNIVQLTGFWTSKYKLRAENTNIPDISGGSAVARINNITEATNSSYICEMYLIRDGKRIVWNEENNEYIDGTEPIVLTGNYIYKNLEPGSYVVNIIVKDKATNKQVKSIANTVLVSESTKPNAPVLKTADSQAFNIDKTFYVTYDEEGNEDSSIPIGEEAPKNWYDYDEQRWANIVVRDNGNEIYYTWIPRYEYKVNSSLEKTNVLFIPASKLADDGYTVPEAFTWEDPNDANNVVQLEGFWAAKYKLRDSITYNLDGIYGSNGKIQIDNIASTFGFGSGYTYEAYAISNGKIVRHNEISGSRGSVTKLDEGEYTVNIIVKDSTGKHIQGIAKSVTVMPGVKVNPPDLSKFNNNVTFYVTKDSNANEISNTPIGEEEPADWYDYDDDKNAVVVVRENGIETYYEWIPRYQCDPKNPTHISYIPTSKTEADENLVIPDEFTDSKGNTLSGYWKNMNETKSNRITANVVATESSIIITNVVLPSGATKANISLIQNGKVVQQSVALTGDNFTYSGLTLGQKYAINIIAYDSNDVMLAGYTEEEFIFKVNVNLDGFNPNTTFYVAYDEEGNEDTSIPIGENPPENWYSYENQKWANIVVRDGGNENYYTWIPRYEYKLNNDGEKAYVRFIPETANASDGYILPEGFTWEDPTDSAKVIQLSGFWASKYKLREGNSVLPDIVGGSGMVRVNNITEATNSSYVCEMYLIKDGKRINGPIELTQNYVFRNIEPGTYSVNIIVKDATTKKQVKAITNEVLVSESIEPNAPELQSFNKNNTFYVTYDDNGNETSIIPIGEGAPENWYSYDEQKWANIVVRDNGQEIYYTWIPRYEYKLNTSQEKTNVLFIPASKLADAGYTVPEAFTWEDPNDENNVIQLSGFWASKYKLRDGNTINLDGIYGAGGKVQIDNIVSAVGGSYTYEAYLIKDGKRVAKKNITGNDKITKLDDGSNIPNGEYVVNIIVKDSTGKQIQGIAKTIEVYEKIQAYEPDLTNYNENTTCFVTYNILGESSSTTPIGEAIPSNWYDYDEDSKATIVVRENGVETYYEWIPRYQCDSKNPTHISYINIGVEPDVGWTIPDVFTGENEKGYWNEIQKYEGRMNANISAGKDKIVVSNITSSSSSYVTYKAYLVKNGKLLQNTTITGDNYTFTGLTEGLYGVHIVKTDANGTTLYSYAQEVRVTSIDTPDLTGFNLSITYYVTYNDDGTEELKPITEAPPDNWYDYAEQKWANIKVVDENGITNYFTWIPRYEYTLNPYAEKTITRFIPKTQIEPSDGYKIPESFTWEDPADSTKVIQLSGFWASKYKLRE